MKTLLKRRNGNTNFKMYKKNPLKKFKTFHSQTLSIKKLESKNVFIGIIPFVISWAFTTDNHKIGLLYLIFGFFTGTFVCKLNIFLQQGLGLELTAYQYSIIETKLNFIILYFCFTPILFYGFGNCFIPQLINSKNLVFPRANSISFWLLILSFLFFLESLLSETKIHTYWLLFPFLEYQISDIDLSMSSYCLYNISIILQAINFIFTILFMNKQKDLTFFKSPLFIHFIFTASLLILFYLISLILETNDFNLFKQSKIFLYYKNPFWIFHYPLLSIVITIISWSILNHVILDSFKSFFSYNIPFIYLMFLSVGVNLTFSIYYPLNSTSSFDLKKKFSAINLITILLVYLNICVWLLIILKNILLKKKLKCRISISFSAKVYFAQF